MSCSEGKITHLIVCKFNGKMDDKGFLDLAENVLYFIVPKRES